MRTYGRIYASDGSWTWVEVSTDASGDNTYVYVTALVQVLKLILNESPFYANYGIPQQESIIQQVFPDYYVNQIQAQFAQYFASLIITKIQSTSPMYNVAIVTKQGVKMAMNIPV